MLWISRRDIAAEIKNKAIGYGMPCAVRNSDIAQGTVTGYDKKIKKVFKNILTFDTTFVKILNCDDELHRTSQGMLPWLSW